MTTRQYSSRSQQTTLTGAITSGATSMTVVSGTGLLGGVTIPAGRTFTLVIDVDTALEEIVDATAVSGNTFTITRARDGSTAQDHSAGAVVRHMAIGRDYRDANLHAEADASYNDGGGNAHTMHGIGAGEGVVVGTDKAQTLTNKTLTSPTISNPTFTGTSGFDASIIFEGATPDAFETTLTVVDPTQDNTITLPNTTGTVVIATATQTLTNKTLTSPVISGSPVITGLSSVGMSTSSATPKDYVDSILGSATAAATSAASAAASATAAATSASSAATSASSALTSANSASTSATAAATSATSAAASATAAATSATSAAASATAAATSATSAEASAITAAASVATISGFATTASNSASAAATSATSAAASATAAATSASSAATSATSAAASYDQFDDRYLGDKTSDPTLDNDGNPLLTGALYFNSVVDAMKVYNGASWDLVAPDTSNFIQKTLLTGKGSIIAASAASTPAELTVAATNGYLLTVNSASATGLEWAAPAASGVSSVTAGSGISVTGTTANPTVAVDSTVIRTTGGQVISANTSANALEIRQTGAGNALVVEDEANPDSTPFVIAANGSVGIGVTPASNESLNISKPIINATGPASLGWGYGLRVNGQVTSLAGTANVAIAVATGISIATSSTVGNVVHYYALPATGSGTVDFQVGFLVDNTFTTGTSSNIAFRSDLESGTNRWNFYAHGTAANYFSGQSTVGSTSLALGAGSVAQQFGVVVSTSTRVGAVIRGASAQSANLTEWQDNSGTVLARVTSQGVLDAPLVTNARVASYTLVLADSSKLVEISNAGATTLTVPTNASVAFPIGTQINVLQTGAGQITVAGTAGVTVNATPGLKLRAQWSSATLVKRGTDTWVLLGDLSA